MVRIIVLQDRSLYHIPLPPIQCCVRIFRATTSSCGNQYWRKGETGVGVPTNVTSIVGLACNLIENQYLVSGQLKNTELTSVSLRVESAIWSLDSGLADTLF